MAVGLAIGACFDALVLGMILGMSVGIAYDSIRVKSKTGRSTEAPVTESS